MICITPFFITKAQGISIRQTASDELKYSYDMRVEIRQAVFIFRQMLIRIIYS